MRIILRFSNYLLISLILFLFHTMAYSQTWEKIDHYDALRTRLGSNEIDSFAKRYVQIDTYDSLNYAALMNVNIKEPLVRITTDGGNTWSVALNDSLVWKWGTGGVNILYRPTQAKGISYPGPGLCVVVCEEGYYWISKDKCRNWERRNLNGINDKLMQVKFFDEKTGVISTWRDLYLTTDGCDSWQKLINNDTSDFAIYEYVQILNENAIFTIGLTNSLENYILTTTDQGKNWERRYTFSERMCTICFIDSLNGWAVGRPSVSNDVEVVKIMHTTDGGYNWEVQLDTITPQQDGLIDVHFTDINNGIALGYWYYMFRTSDGGQNWKRDSAYTGKLIEDYFEDFAMHSQNCVLGISRDLGNIYKYIPEPSSVLEGRAFSVKNYPNPSHGNVNFEVTIESADRVVISLYDLEGRIIKEIDSGILNAGTYIINEDLSFLPSGEYLYSLAVGRFYKFGKVVLAK